MSLWVVRILFLLLCTVSGYAVSQYRPEIIDGGIYGIMIGFGLGGLLIAIDHMLKGFSLRAFSAATFGMFLGTLLATLIDRNELFVYTSVESRWVVRLGMFLSFGYLGMVLALRSNKDDFSFIIPYVRFKAQHEPENLLLLDTSVIIDGRILDLVEARFVDGIIVVPRFVLKELQSIADLSDPIRRARGRRGLEMLGRLQNNPKAHVRIHEADLPEESDVDAKLVRLARNLGARLFTTDYNLGKVAELQQVACVNIAELSNALRPTIISGDVLTLRLVREGKERGQALAYLNDGTMVVVNHAQHLIGQVVQVQVSSLRQTGAGIIIFAEVKDAVHTPVLSEAV
jgi:uncharacterized protein YacL